MDGENNGTAYEQMDDLGGAPIFWNIHMTVWALKAKSMGEMIVSKHKLRQRTYIAITIHMFLPKAPDKCSAISPWIVLQSWSLQKNVLSIQIKVIGMYIPIGSM